ncbi:MAG: hypothetical protein K2W95_27545 [Candidatus Obscuribacterales bacterium]|nr:hypothetical protein [Candidatus Obscuribacterales bacterium]
MSGTDRPRPLEALDDDDVIDGDKALSSPAVENFQLRSPTRSMANGFYVAEVFRDKDERILTAKTCDGKEFHIENPNTGRYTLIIPGEDEPRFALGLEYQEGAPNVLSYELSNRKTIYEFDDGIKSTRSKQGLVRWFNQQGVEIEKPANRQLPVRVGDTLDEAIPERNLLADETGLQPKLPHGRTNLEPPALAASENLFPDPTERRPFNLGKSDSSVVEAEGGTTIQSFLEEPLERSLSTSRNGRAFLAARPGSVNMTEEFVRLAAGKDKKLLHSQALLSDLCILHAKLVLSNPAAGDGQIQTAITSLIPGNCKLSLLGASEVNQQTTRLKALTDKLEAAVTSDELQEPYLNLLWKYRSLYPDKFDQAIDNYSKSATKALDDRAVAMGTHCPQTALQLAELQRTLAHLRDEPFSGLGSGELQDAMQRISQQAEGKTGVLPQALREDLGRMMLSLAGTRYILANGEETKVARSALETLAKNITDSQALTAQETTALLDKLKSVKELNLVQYPLCPDKADILQLIDRIGKGGFAAQPSGRDILMEILLQTTMSSRGGAQWDHHKTWGDLTPASAISLNIYSLSEADKAGIRKAIMDVLPDAISGTPKLTDLEFAGVALAWAKDGTVPAKVSEAMTSSIKGRAHLGARFFEVWCAHDKEMIGAEAMISQYLSDWRKNGRYSELIGRVQQKSAEQRSDIWRVLTHEVAGNPDAVTLLRKGDYSAPNRFVVGELAENILDAERSPEERQRLFKLFLHFPSAMEHSSLTAYLRRNKDGMQTVADSLPVLSKETNENLLRKVVEFARSEGKLFTPEFGKFLLTVTEKSSSEASQRASFELFSTVVWTELSVNEKQSFKEQLIKLFAQHDSTKRATTPIPEIAAKITALVPVNQVVSLPTFLRALGTEFSDKELLALTAEAEKRVGSANVRRYIATAVAMVFVTDILKDEDIAKALPDKGKLIDPGELLKKLADGTADADPRSKAILQLNISGEFKDAIRKLGDEQYHLITELEQLRPDLKKTLEDLKKHNSGGLSAAARIADFFIKETYQQDFEDFQTKKIADADQNQKQIEKAVARLLIVNAGLNKLGSASEILNWEYLNVAPDEFGKIPTRMSTITMQDNVLNFFRQCGYLHPLMLPPANATCPNPVKQFFLQQTGDNQQADRLHSAYNQLMDAPQSCDSLSQVIESLSDAKDSVARDALMDSTIAAIGQSPSMARLSNTVEEIETHQERLRIALQAAHDNANFKGIIADAKAHAKQVESLLKSVDPKDLANLQHIRLTVDKLLTAKADELSPRQKRNLEMLLEQVSLTERLLSPNYPEPSRYLTTKLTAELYAAQHLLKEAEARNASKGELYFAKEKVEQLDARLSHLKQNLNIELTTLVSDFGKANFENEASTWNIFRKNAAILLSTHAVAVTVGALVAAIASLAVPPLAPAFVTMTVGLVSALATTAAGHVAGSLAEGYLGEAGLGYGHIGNPIYSFSRAPSAAGAEQLSHQLPGLAAESVVGYFLGHLGSVAGSHGKSALGMTARHALPAKGFTNTFLQHLNEQLFSPNIVVWQNLASAVLSPRPQSPEEMESAGIQAQVIGQALNVLFSALSARPRGYRGNTLEPSTRKLVETVVAVVREREMLSHSESVPPMKAAGKAHGFDPADCLNDFLQAQLLARSLRSGSVKGPLVEEQLRSVQERISKTRARLGNDADRAAFDALESFTRQLTLREELHSSSSGQKDLLLLKKQLEQSVQGGSLTQEQANVLEQMAVELASVLAKMNLSEPQSNAQWKSLVIKHLLLENESMQRLMRTFGHAAADPFWPAGTLRVPVEGPQGEGHIVTVITKTPVKESVISLVLDHLRSSHTLPQQVEIMPHGEDGSFNAESGLLRVRYKTKTGEFMTILFHELGHTIPLTDELNMKLIQLKRKSLEAPQAAQVIDKTFGKGTFERLRAAAEGREVFEGSPLTDDEFFLYCSANSEIVAELYAVYVRLKKTNSPLELRRGLEDLAGTGRDKRLALLSQYEEVWNFLVTEVFEPKDLTRSVLRRVTGEVPPSPLPAERTPQAQQRFIESEINARRDRIREAALEEVLWSRFGRALERAGVKREKFSPESLPEEVASYYRELRSSLSQSSDGKSPAMQADARKLKLLVAECESAIKANIESKIRGSSGETREALEAKLRVLLEEENSHKKGSAPDEAPPVKLETAEARTERLRTQMQASETGSDLLAGLTKKNRDTAEVMESILALTAAEREILGSRTGLFEALTGALVSKVIDVKALKTILNLEAPRLKQCEALLKGTRGQELIVQILQADSTVLPSLLEMAALPSCLNRHLEALAAAASPGSDPDRIRTAKAIACSGVRDSSVLEGLTAHVLSNDKQRWQNARGIVSSGIKDMALMARILELPSQMQSDVVGARLSLRDKTDSDFRRLFMLDGTPEVLGAVHEIIRNVNHATLLERLSRLGEFRTFLASGLISPAQLKQFCIEPHYSDIISGRILRDTSAGKIEPSVLRALLSMGRDGTIGPIAMEAYGQAIRDGLLNSNTLAHILQSSSRLAYEKILCNPHEACKLAGGESLWLDALIRGGEPGVQRVADKLSAVQQILPELFPEKGYRVSEVPPKSDSPVIHAAWRIAQAMQAGDFVEALRVAREFPTPMEEKMHRIHLSLGELTNVESLRTTLESMSSNRHAQVRPVVGVDSSESRKYEINCPVVFIELREGLGFDLHDSSQVYLYEGKPPSYTNRAATPQERALIEQVQKSVSGRALLGKEARIRYEERVIHGNQGDDFKAERHGTVSALTLEFMKSPQYRELSQLCASENIRLERVHEIDVVAALVESGMSLESVETLFGKAHRQEEREFFYQWMQSRKQSEQK